MSVACPGLFEKFATAIESEGETELEVENAEIYSNFDVGDADEFEHSNEESDVHQRSFAMMTDLRRALQSLSVL